MMIQGLNKIYFITLASIVVVHILIGFNMFVSFHFNIFVSVIFGDTPFSCRMPEFAIDIAQISCDNLIIMKVNTFFDQQHFENQSLNCFTLELRDYSERLFFYLCSCILKPYTPLNAHSLNHLIPFRVLLVMKHFHKIEVLLEIVLFR